MVLFLQADTENKFRGFADFFPLYSQEFKKRVKIISTEEFVKKEGGPGGKAPTPESMRVKILHSMENCDKREKSKTQTFERSCNFQLRIFSILNPSFLFLSQALLGVDT